MFILLVGHTLLIYYILVMHTHILHVIKYFMDYNLGSCTFHSPILASQKDNQSNITINVWVHRLLPPSVLLYGNFLPLLRNNHTHTHVYMFNTTYTFMFLLISHAQLNSYNFKCLPIMGINSSETHNTKLFTWWINIVISIDVWFLT